MTNSKHHWLLLVLRLWVGGLLVYAGVQKLGAAPAFAEEIAAFRIGEWFGDMGTYGVHFTAITLPWLEFIVGIFLIADAWTRAAAGIASALFIFFAVVVATALVRGLDISCGCFGTIDAALLGWKTLGLDLLGLIPAIAIFVLLKVKPSS